MKTELGENMLTTGRFVRAFECSGHPVEAETREGSEIMMRARMTGSNSS